MSDQCTDLPGSAVKTLVLAVDLVGYELENGPKRVAEALQNKAVLEAIQKALKEEAEKILKEQKEGLTVDGREAASRLAAEFGKAVLDAGSKQVKDDIEKSAAYKKVEKSLKDLECAFKKSKVGVFIDENKTVLIIVASGVVVGAATAMYVAGVGDKPLEWATDLAEKKLKGIQLGKIDLSVPNLKIEPSTKRIEVEVGVNTARWKAIPATDFKVHAHTKDEKVVALGFDVETKLPLAKGFYMPFGAGVDPVADKYRFSLGIVGQADGLSVQIGAERVLSPEKDSWGVKSGIGYKGTVFNAPFSLDAAGGVGQVTTYPGPNIMDAQPVTKTDVRVNVGLKVMF